MSAPPHPAHRAAGAALAFALEVPALLLLFSGSRHAPVGAALALLAIAGARLGRLKRPAGIVQAAVQLIALTVALGALTAFSGQSRPSFGVYVTVGGLAIALPQLWWTADRAGNAAALGAGLVALMGLARTVERPVFALGVAAYLAAGLVATMLRDGGWPAFFRHRRGALLPLIGALLIAGGVLGGLGWALPAAEPAVSRALSPYLFGGAGTSGFGEGRIKLGEAGRITLDDDVKLRVEGRTDHLRGRIYVDYRGGDWAMRPIPGYSGPPFVPGTPLPLDHGDARPRATLTIEGTPDSGLALFAPLGALRLDTGPELTRLDPYGILELAPEMISEPRTWTLQITDPAAPGRRPHIDRPTEHDLALPKKWADRFTDLAATWTAGHADDRARLAAITRRFAQDFTYSLELVEPPQRVDPTWWFLNFSRAGHCEYFASGLTLLARALGLPARMVAGYRVVEHNPVGDYAIVRGRDAHAWVEIWLDGRWHTWDPTPPGALGEHTRQTTGWWSARWDVFERSFGRVFERLADLSVVELTAALGGISILLLAWLRIRRRRAVRAIDDAERFGPLMLLEQHLAARHRLERPPHEPLARFAARLRAADLAPAAALVDDCRALRYGHRGDPDTLADAIDAFIRHDGRRGIWHR